MTDEQRKQRTRLKAWMKLEGIKRESLAKKIGYKKEYLDQVLSGGNAVSKALLYEISKYYNLDTEWVENGEGEMYKELPGARMVEEAEVVTYEPDPLSALRRMMDEHLEMMRLLEEHRDEIEALKDRVGELEKKLNSKL